MLPPDPAGTVLGGVGALCRVHGGGARSLITQKFGVNVGTISPPVPRPATSPLTGGKTCCASHAGGMGRRIRRSPRSGKAGSDGDRVKCVRSKVLAAEVAGEYRRTVAPPG